MPPPEDRKFEDTSADHITFVPDPEAGGPEEGAARAEPFRGTQRPGRPRPAPRPNPHA